MVCLVRHIGAISVLNIQVNGRDKVICVNKMEANEVEKKVCHDSLTRCTK